MFKTDNLSFTHHRLAKSKYCSAQIEVDLAWVSDVKACLLFFFLFNEKIYKVVLKAKTCPTNIHLKKTRNPLLVTIGISAEK